MRLKYDPTLAYIVCLRYTAFVLYSPSSVCIVLIPLIARYGCLAIIESILLPQVFVFFGLFLYYDLINNKYNHAVLRHTNNGTVFIYDIRYKYKTKIRVIYNLCRGLKKKKNYYESRKNFSANQWNP